MKQESMNLESQASGTRERIWRAPEMNVKYNVWLHDDTWAISGNMPLDGMGVSMVEAKREYRELVKEYGTGQLLILPAGLSIADHDEFGTLGGLYVVETK